MNQRTESKSLSGKLIRRIIKTAKQMGFERIFDQNQTSDILIAVSGGPDSVALAHLLIHQVGTKGQRLRKRIILGHINHGWRNEASDEDAAWVSDLAKSWSVRFVEFSIKDKRPPAGESLEAFAHHERKKIFETWTRQFPGAWILTGHHQDDLAETVFWRMSRGELGRMPDGIRYAQALGQGHLIRPLLEVTKAELIQYLQGVKQEFRLDMTNQDTRFTRNEIRLQVLPELNRRFPNFSKNLAAFALQAQIQPQLNREAEKDSASSFPWGLIESHEGLKVRRSHRVSIDQIRSKPSDDKGFRRFPFSGGWQLRQDRTQIGETERWVLIRSGQSPHDEDQYKLSE